ncbi:hypothetical protein [Planococcus donghaensis]|uniref:Zinc-finger domain-containing protein n=1 Tax=Planococcus donghaensis TaxID=414778 RepID=A0A1C7EHA7_9BACL|nr:hypothetical protein [Planococcus donghaensis]ANU23354.1 hypothetical protein BCM40_08205 [Planococcus donghaensis]
MECEFILSYINGSHLIKEEYAEILEQHLVICSTCQELYEIMGDLPSIEEDLFSIEMKARILAKVFEEDHPTS